MHRREVAAIGAGSGHPTPRLACQLLHTVARVSGRSVRCTTRCTGSCFFLKVQISVWRSDLCLAVRSRCGRVLGVFASGLLWNGGHDGKLKAWSPPGTTASCFSLASLVVTRPLVWRAQALREKRLEGVVEHLGPGCVHSSDGALASRPCVRAWRGRRPLGIITAPNYPRVLRWS